MRRHRQLLGAVSLFALAAGGAAVAFTANPPQPIEIGAEIAGDISLDDPFLESEWDEGVGQRFDHYTFDARAGQRIEIIMRSDAFDTYLEIGRDGETLASDDDGLGEGVNSRLRFTAPADGAYYLIARPLFTEGAAGAYTLSVQERPPSAPAPDPTPVRIGDTIEGTLDAGDPESDRGPVYDSYSFRLREGEPIWITQTSDAFDTYLQIGRQSAGGVFEELAVNDDSGGGLNSGLLFTAPETSRFVVRATAYAQAEGPYVLSLSEPPPPTPVAPIAIGQTLEGDLADTDAETLDGRRHDAWGFHVEAGQRVSIEMRSDDFDTYLALGRDGPAGFESFAEDDDGLGEGLNSRLTWTFDEAGDYVIHARAFGEEGRGPYSLSLAEIAPPPPPTPIAFGETVQGEITGEDGETSDRRHSDAYAFTGAAGQRIQAIMRSGDFDSYLEIGSADGEFLALASDDDGLGEGLDSRLNFTLPEGGDYILRASPLGPDGRGLYALQLVDRGPEPAPGSILIGATARGTLSEADSIADDGSFFDAYRFYANEGDKLRLTMTSNEFDALLMLGTQEEGSMFELIASDDDGLSDTQAMIEQTIETTGWYVLRANSFGPGRTGYYSLTVERQP